MTYARINGMRSARFPLQGCGCVGDCGCAGTPVLAVSGLGCGCVAAPVMAGLGYIPANWDTWPLPARVVDIQIRAKSSRALVVAMGAALRRADATSQLDPYASVLDVISSLPRRTAAAPLQVVRNMVMYGAAQVYRLSTAALAAADSVLVDKSNPNSAVKSPQSIERLRLALRAVDLAEQIQARLLQIFNALPQSGAGGLGDAMSAGAVLGIGLLFAPISMGASIPISVLVALAELFGLADGVIDAIGSAIEFVIAPLKDVARDVAAGAVAGVGSVLKYALIGGSVLILGIVAYQYATYRVGKAILKSPTGRKLVGAAVGGPVGASLAANRRRSSRRRRTSQSPR